MCEYNSIDELIKSDEIDYDFVCLSDDIDKAEEKKETGNVYAYLRVSTETKENDKEKQNFLRQLKILSDSEIKFTAIYEERVSGKSNTSTRPKFKDMFNALSKGDTVVFTEISRFSRNYIDGMTVIDLLTQDKAVNVRFLKEGITLYANGRYGSSTWLQLAMNLLLAEYERRQISERTVDALKAKKAHGVHIGRKTDMEKHIERYEQIKELYKQGYSQTEVCKILKLSRQSLIKTINLVECVAGKEEGTIRRRKTQTADKD